MHSQVVIDFAVLLLLVLLISVHFVVFVCVAAIF